MRGRRRPWSPSAGGSLKKSKGSRWVMSASECLPRTRTLAHTLAGTKSPQSLFEVHLLSESCPCLSEVRRLSLLLYILGNIMVDIFTPSWDVCWGRAQCFCKCEYMVTLALTHQKTRIVPCIIIGLTAYKSFTSTAKTQTEYQPPTAMPRLIVTKEGN